MPTSRPDHDAALQESRERLQAALDGSGAGTFRWNIETNALDWDENLDRLFGLPAGQTVRSLDKFIAAVHPDERAGVIGACRRCADEGADFDMEFRVVWPDGTVRWLSDQGRTFRDRDGRPAYMTGMCLDITDRKRIYDRHRALIEATGNIVWTNNAEGQMRGPQPGWCEYTGQSEADVQGYGWAKAVHPEDAQPTIDAWRRAVETRTTFRFQHRVRRRDGVYRWFGISAVPVLEPSGEVREWVGLHRDIHEETAATIRVQEAMQEVERANRAKDEFLAMLGHELRNPLSPITTAVHLMKLRGTAPREVTVIERQTHHLTRLVDDLLDVSRITGGKIRITKERCELSALVAAALETAGSLIENARHELVIDVPVRGLAIDADRTRMTQVLGNLLTNAAKYTPTGGRITIRAWRENGRIVVAVSDNGDGIAPDLLPHVFDLFVQARQTIDRAQGGLGLGLAIVKSLVTLHGGEVEARSDGPGRGATFTLRLPASAAVQPAEALQDLSLAVQSRKRFRVLVVDDNVDGAEMLSTLLAESGYDVTTANDGPSALEVARGFDADVALLDIGLPIMDGYELAAALRAEHPRLVLVAVTGYGLQNDRERTRAAGFAAHLTKPIDLVALQRVIGHVRDGQPFAPIATPSAPFRRSS